MMPIIFILRYCLPGRALACGGSGSGQRKCASRIVLLKTDDTAIPQRMNYTPSLPFEKGRVTNQPPTTAEWRHTVSASHNQQLKNNDHEMTCNMHACGQYNRKNEKEVVCMYSCSRCYAAAYSLVTERQPPQEDIPCPSHLSITMVAGRQNFGWFSSSGQDG